MVCLFIAIYVSMGFDFMECGDLCAGLWHCGHGFKDISLWVAIMYCGVFDLSVSKYRTLRQSVKICVGSSRYVVVRSWRVWCMAIISARSMFCSPGSLTAIFRFFIEL